jgi:hypothetical protein
MRFPSWPTFTNRRTIAAAILLGGGVAAALKLAAGWRIELVAEASGIINANRIVVAPDGTVLLGQDRMDMAGPPTEPAGSLVAIKSDHWVSGLFSRKWNRYQFGAPNSRRTPGHTAQAAAGSGCQRARIFPSVSLKYRNQPIPGTGVLGMMTWPPRASALAPYSSTLSTLM